MEKITVLKKTENKTKNKLGKAVARTAPDNSEESLFRVRRICSALPQTTEKLSHGEPTFFTNKKVYAMLAINHHDDGHIAVYVPVPPGLQATLIKTEPDKFFMPPYVGVRGWVGLEIDRVSDEELGFHLTEAWRMISPKKRDPAITSTKRRNYP